jgi:hypothetical protein
MKAKCGLAPYIPTRDELRTLEKTRAKELRGRTWSERHVKLQVYCYSLATHAAVAVAWWWYNAARSAQRCVIAYAGEFQRLTQICYQRPDNIEVIESSEQPLLAGSSFAGSHRPANLRERPAHKLTLPPIKPLEGHEDFGAQVWQPAAATPQKQFEATAQLNSLPCV